jgi:hypothetical protein
MTLLCSFHHHRVHEGGYRLRRDEHGELHCTRPDGTPLTVPKGPAPPHLDWNSAA